MAFSLYFRPEKGSSYQRTITLISKNSDAACSLPASFSLSLTPRVFSRISPRPSLPVSGNEKNGIMPPELPELSQLVSADYGLGPNPPYEAQTFHIIFRNAPAGRVSRRRRGSPYPLRRSRNRCARRSKSLQVWMSNTISPVCC